jgi:hypothetical protein
MLNANVGYGGRIYGDFESPYPYSPNYPTHPYSAYSTVLHPYYIFIAHL